MKHTMQMSVERAARSKIGRPGTVHERDKHILAVVIDDLSTSGCFVRGDFAIEVGALLSVNVPGIGMQAARVRRATADGVGCGFLMPISAAEVDIARRFEAVDTVDEAEADQRRGFIQMKQAIRSASNEAHSAAATTSQNALKSWLSEVSGALRRRR